MILTGKALEDFKKWKVDNMRLSTIEVLDFKYLSIVSQNAIIIEWFDSVGIHILITDFEGEDYWCELNGLKHSILGKTRQEAITQVIIKANEIYNEKKSTRTNIY